jgi:CRP-like cAMP-binding protein
MVTQYSASHSDDHLKISLMQRQPCFGQLTDEEVAGLASLLEKAHYDVGDVIVTEGDMVDSVYFIINGTADVRHVYIENKKTVFKSIATLGEGQSIGLSATGFYSLSGLRTATVVALTEVEAFRLSIPAFNGFALAHPHVGAALRSNVSAET